jgi:hypothetical protein
MSCTSHLTYVRLCLPFGLKLLAEPKTVLFETTGFGGKSKGKVVPVLQLSTTS